MTDDQRPADEGLAGALGALRERLDTVAGAIASLVASHRALGTQLQEAETRRTQDAKDTARRLDGLEQELLAVPVAAMPARGATYDAAPPAPEVADLLDAVALSLEVQMRLAEIVERLDHRIEGPPTDAPAPVAPIDVTGALSAVTDELGARLTLHTDAAVAGAVRLIDGRLATLREELQKVERDLPGGPPAANFEAGAVMGAAQAAWNRLEQRLDAEFDELSRQLAAMAGLLETAAASAEAAASRPVVTGDQLRKAAASVRNSVIVAGRSRWERRGGQRGIGPGS